MKKLKNLEELANTIIVRNHIMGLVQSATRGFASKEEIKKLREFVSEVDDFVIQSVLSEEDELLKKVSEPKVVLEDSSKSVDKKPVQLKKAKAVPKPKAEVVEQKPKNDDKPKAKAKLREGVVRRVLD